MDTTQRRIVVGVAGPEDSEAAVRYAVEESGRSHLPVQLVHALHPMVFSEDNLTAVAPHPLVDRAGQLLDEIADRVRRELGPEAVVTTDLVLGHPASALVDESRGAALLVLQPERMGQPRHIPTYSVTSAVAARARMPVVAVPADWSGSDGVVTVGVDAVGGSTPLLRAAFEEAQARHATLRVVHAWHYSPYDSVVFEGERLEAESAQLEREISSDLASLQRKFGEVPVELSVSHGRPADALVDASTRSSLIVVGRHHTSHRLGRHLGSIVRAVLRESRCPVLVVDPADPA